MFISRSLFKQMGKDNRITREDLWRFIQEHKDKAKSEFGGWLIGQEVTRTDKMIMAVDLWNEAVTEKLKQEMVENRKTNFGEVVFH